MVLIVNFLISYLLKLLNYHLIFMCVYEYFITSSFVNSFRKTGGYFDETMVTCRKMKNFFPFFIYKKKFIL